VSHITNVIHHKYRTACKKLYLHKISLALADRKDTISLALLDHSQSISRHMVIGQAMSFRIVIALYIISLLSCNNEVIGRLQEHDEKGQPS
jgi:hypothetical protein